MVKVIDKYVKGFIDNKTITRNQVKKIHKMIEEQTGLGSEYTGWVHQPIGIDQIEYERIYQAADKIQAQSEVLVVIGIGGSYLGTKAALEMLRDPFNNTGVEVIFAGHQISAAYTNSLLKYLEDKRFSINVISKSGTTTEPAIAFRIFKDLLYKKFEDADQRIYVTTDKEHGALKTLADEMGYDTYVVPSDIGGRFSVLSAVGLLPLKAAGIDTDFILEGAVDAYYDLQNVNNEAYKYATLRSELYRQGKSIEVLVNYEPQLIYLSEWWKQLFGESEGKDHKSLFVSSASFSTDLHSLGQMIQEGTRNLFETVIKVKQTKLDQTIPYDQKNLDGLNYLAGKSMQEVNEKAFLGTLVAHTDGGVPNIVIEIDTIDGYHFGYLVYFFFKACAMSAYLLEVNPFNQPGVESYKKNMFALLGKDGYQDLKEEIEAKLKKGV